MVSAYLAVLVFVLASVDFSYTQFEQPCCGPWVKEGWMGLSKSPPPSPEAICVNGTTRMKFIKNMRMKILFKPNSRYGVVGLSACRDEAQNDCYVADIFGLESGRLGYWWRKHTPYEKGGKGWVPGRAEKLEETKLQQESRVSQGTWDQEGSTTYVFYVERSPRGRLEIRLDGGDAEQQVEMAFSLPDEYNKIAVGSYFSAGKAEVVGAAGCGYPRRIRFRPGQEMRLKWSPGDKVNAVGVAFCSDSGQSECYVLDMFGESNRQLHFWWRRHSSKEKGANGWVPGKDGRFPEAILKGGPNTTLIWPSDRMHLMILFKRAFDGKLTVRVEGGDPNQNENLIFELKPKYQFGAVDILHRGKKGAAVGVLGPCFNGELFGYFGETCTTSVNLNGILTSSSGGRREVWSPRPGRSRAEMTSPPVEVPSGSERLCVSVSGIASQGARISIDAIPAGGDSTDGIRVGELADNGLNPPEWQHSRLVVDLPPNLRTGSLNLVLTAEREPGSLLILQSAELCGTQDCGVATARGRPFISYGENASLAEFPWHAGIYNNLDGKQICGGSLVRPDIVISAAHCFHDKNEVLRDKSGFKIAVGKLYSDIRREEPYQQISDITAIHIPERYRGSKRDFEHDLAIVEVKFVFTSVVVPLCVDWTGRNLPVLRTGESGLVAGWGLTENRAPSPVLLFGRLPYIPFEECTKVVPPTFLRYITADKFCAGNINGTTVEPGDSGGGLAFLTAGRWYLRGVVSTGVPNQLTYSTFVDINYFIDWIRGIVPAAAVSSRNALITT